MTDKSAELGSATKEIASEDELARGIIRALLDGTSPDGIAPSACGPWSEVVGSLYEAYSAGGTERVRATFTALTNVTPDLVYLISSEFDTGFFLEEDASDEGNAQCVHQLHGHEFLYCDAYGWMHFNGRFYSRTHAEAALERAIVKVLDHRRKVAVEHKREDIVKVSKSSAYVVRNCKYLLRSLATVSVGEFDRSPDHINCRNGLLNLKTGGLTPHSSDQRFTYCLPVDYDAKAGWQDWENFLSPAVRGGQEMVEYLQEAVGYSLTGHTREECLFYIHGPTRAGKGTFAEALQAMFGGRPLAVQVAFGTFTRKRDSDTNNADLASLKPCRFVVAGESGRGQWLNAEKIKLITGGDEVFCAFKYRDHFSYRPQYKIWLVSNYAVKVDVDDDAAWGRVRTIEFPKSHAGHEDKLLKEHMKRPEILKQVLAWAVAGAMRWYERGHTGLPLPELVQAATKDARDRIDFVQQWLDQCITRSVDPDVFLPNKELYASYQLWCEEQGVKPKGNGALTQALKRKGYRAGESKKVDGNSARGCYGIRLSA